MESPGVLDESEVPDVLLEMVGETVCPPCDGTRRIAHGPAISDEYFRDVTENRPTPVLSVSVFLASSSVPFLVDVNTFSVLGKMDGLDQLCFTQHQVVELCQSRDHMACFALMASHYFLLREKGEFLIVRVFFMGGSEGMDSEPYPIIHQHKGNGNDKACSARILVPTSGLRIPPQVLQG